MFTSCFGLLLYTESEPKEIILAIYTLLRLNLYLNDPFWRDLKVMNNLFDVLKMVRFNHFGFDPAQVVITDVAGKPNSILTDLYRDVVSKINLFINLDEADTPQEVISSLKLHTPLPLDVLDEYGKILDEPLLGINFAPQKGQMELLVRG